MFAQDAWNVTPSLTLKFGARYDQVQYENDAGDEVADLDEVQPRIGLAWQVGEDARTMVRLSWGRFTDPSALFLPNRAQTRPLAPSDNYISCNDLLTPAGIPVTMANCSAVVGSVFGSSGAFITDPWAGLSRFRRALPPTRSHRASSPPCPSKWSPRSSGASAREPR